MIKFNCNILSSDTDISPFELGDIEIVSDGVVISSNGKSPSQSMMIFIALSDLLDCICKFINDTNIVETTFVGTDSSFILTFTKSNQNVYIKNREQSIFVQKKEMVEALYSGINNLYALYSDALENANNYFDLKNSLLHFKKNCVHTIP